MFDVTALGEILIDFTMQGRNAQGQRVFAQNAGGAPANVLAAMAKLGAKTAFIGKAGNDMHGKFLKETVKNCGIDDRGFILSDEYFTTLAFVNVRDDGEREFSFARSHGADKMLRADEIPFDLICDSKILHIGSISLTDEPVKSATMAAVTRAKENGSLISYDPNYRENLWRSEETAQIQMRDMLKFADLVKISDEETELMTDEVSYEKAAEAIIDGGAKIAVVTLGKDGAYVRTADGGELVKGFECKAVDATGAGDAFWGGFLYKFTASGKSIEEVKTEEAAEFARFGNAVAGVCVENYGAIPSMPDIKQAEAKLSEKSL